MSFSIETLQDFVVNIINDDAAKASYLADPVAALSDAGLGDLSPADVQEVLPLVADSLPGGLPTDLSALPVDLGDLPLDLPAGVPGLDAVSGALPAVPGLDGLTGALPAVPGLDAVTGALPAVPGLDGLTGALPAVPGLDAVSGALPAVPGLDGLTGALPGLDAVSGVLPAVPGLDAVSGILPTGDLPALSEAPMDGAPGLGALPVLGDLPVGDLPAALPELGAIPVSLPALPVDVPTGLPGLGDLPGLPNLGDVAGNLPVDVPQLPTLSAPVLGDITAGVDDASAKLGVAGDLIDSATSGYLANPDNSDAPTISNATSTAFGDLVAGAKLDPQEFGGSAGLTSDLADVGGGLVGHAGGDVSTWGGIDTPAGDLAVGALVSPQDGVTVAAQSPLGDLNLDFGADGGQLSINPGDPSDLLDAQNLGDTGDAVVGTVAHAVTVSGGVLAENVSGGSEGLGGLLTGTAGTVADTLDSTTSTVTNGLSTGTDVVTDHASSLPSVDDLQVPQLPQVPDLGATDLPQVTDVTSHLPSLPVDVPDVSGVTHGVTDLVSHNPVVDVVHSTPVGGAVEGVTDHLTQVTDHLGDLNLGL